jgi:RHS repeat-associated protein
VDGLSYDAAGNLQNDGNHSYAYDAENRIVSVDNGADTYVYDAEGKRVQQKIGSQTCSHWYDQRGRVVIRASAAGATCATYQRYAYVGNTLLGTYTNYAANQSIAPFFYAHGDWTGTERARVDSTTGTSCQTVVSLSFGDGQVVKGTCGTVTSDLDFHHFTGKERDAESGLDNFGARYHASTMGRFMTPDSPSYSNRKNPQSWNLYAYALNNPVSFRDADGHKIECANNTQQCQKDAAAATANAEAAKRVTTQTTTTQHSFLGLFHWTTSETHIAITGDINSFRNLSTNAAKLADLVSDSRTVTVSYDSVARQSGWDTGLPLHGGSTSYMNPFLAIIDPSRTPGAVYDPDAVPQHIPQANTGEEFAHEVLGHIWGDMVGGAPAGTRGNMRDSIAAEDAVRETDPTRGQKGIESHHNYQEMPELQGPDD